MENTNLNQPLSISLELGSESEANVLSTLLKYPNSVMLDEAFGKLNVNDFENIPYRNVYGVLVRLYRANASLDPSIVIEHLVSQRSMALMEAQQVMTLLTTRAVNYESLSVYVEIVKMASIIRKLSKFGEELQNLDVDFTSFDDKMVKLEQEFLSVIKSKVGGTIESVKKFTDSFMDKLRKAYDEQIVTGTTTGYEQIDRLTNGFQPGDLIILAARPGRGKTAFSINLLINIAKSLQENEVAVMFSLEMGGESIVKRMVSIESMVQFNIASIKFLDKESSSSVIHGVKEVGELPILIDDSSNITISEIQSRLKQIASTKKIKLVVVDYLQLVKATATMNSGMSRQQEVAIISHGLKSIARDLEVPVLALAQLSRKIEERRGADGKPLLSDLRESGSIEQDADLVCFLHTVNDNDEASNEIRSTQEDIEFIIAKHRNGPTGKADLLFMKDIGKFTSKQMK